MFEAAVYRERRERLVRLVGGGLVLLPGHEESPINYRDNPYPFRQDSTLLYFGGPSRPGIALLIDADAGVGTLYVAEPHADDIVWTGPVPAAAELASLAGIERSAPLAALEGDLQRAESAGRRVHRLPSARGGGAHAVSEVLRRAVVELRACKSDGEVAQIELALQTTREMHHLAMRHARSGVVEQAVVGAMEGLVIGRGLRTAYPTIFSSRGEILHNHRHHCTLKDGDLVVNDSGAESPLGYASDITRTIPASGRFTPLQRDLYALVLDAQQQVIAMLRPGLPFRDGHLHACRVLVEGLIAMGFMRGSADDAVARGAHALLFPCGIGHLLGLDVHDLEGLGEDVVGYGEGFARSTLPGHRHLRLARPLREGFVVTIEPGLYFNRWLTQQWQAQRLHADLVDHDAVARHLDFGGIRIEDDVLITADGARVLGPAIARTIDEVEAACAGEAREQASGR